MAKFRVTQTRQKLQWRVVEVEADNEEDAKFAAFDSDKKWIDAKSIGEPTCEVEKTD